MVDFTKATAENQTCISKLYSFAEKNLKPHKPQNNNYICFSNGSSRFRLEFRKIFQDGKFIGFRNVEVCFSPHYIFNNDWHNGNDFTPLESITTIRETFLSIGITENEMSEFKVCTLEYGLNLSTGLDIESLIDGILYTKKNPFKVPDKKIKYFKISDTTSYKEIKAYAKGIQCHGELNATHVDRNIFRFEVRSKQSKRIDNIGFPNFHDHKKGFCVVDLLKIENYNSLFQSILDEWENVLIINLEEKDAINTADFWSEILAHQDRNKFYKTKLKYYENSNLKINVHHLIKCKIIDKIIELQKGANSTQKTPANIKKFTNEKTCPSLINLEYAPFNNNNKQIIRRCEVTNLDISDQRKGSKFIREKTLKRLKENDPKTYQKLERKYLTEKMKTEPLEKQVYHIAKNIRDQESNPRNNRKLFEKRNYKKDQLRLNF